MNWSVEFAPIIPLPLYWAAVVATIALAAVLFLRGTRGAALRTTALAALLVALANPTLKEEQRESLANIAIVVMDETTSQALAKRPEQLKSIQDELDRRLGRIKNLEVRTVTVKSKADGRSSGTQLFNELNAALANTPSDRIAGVVMVTDGQVHDVPETTAALGFDAPIHALLTGKPEEFDRRLEIVKAPRYGLVGQSRMIEVKVVETGTSPEADRPLALRITREDQPDEVQQVFVGQTLEIEMPFPHAGTNIVEMQLEATPGELTPANNRNIVSAEGVRENLRVLLVSGEPHAGERTWRNLLKSDAAVDLVHFTILRPPEKQDGTPINQLSLIAFPTRELFSEKIRDFDLIIFDRYQHRGILQLLYYDNIARYVDEHGGAVLVAAGDDYASNLSIYRTPLAPVLPAVPTGRVLERPFKASITEEGLKHPVTRDLPGAPQTAGANAEPQWGRWFRQVEIAPDRGRTVMTGIDDQPLLVLNRQGRGRVALLASDHAWLWARGFDGGGPHTDLLRRLSHWLMGEPDLEEEQLFATSNGLKITLERRSMMTQVGPVTLRTPRDEEIEVTLEKDRPGVWTADVDVALPGLYKAEMQGPEDLLTALVHAGVQDRRELSEVTATSDKLKPIIDGTGGGAFWTASDGVLSNLTGTQSATVDLPRVTMMSDARVFAGSNWMGFRDRQAYLTKGVRVIPMFDGMLALAGLLFLMSIAWWREGR